MRGASVIPGSGWIMLLLCSILVLINQCDSTPQDPLVHIPDVSLLDGLIASGVDTDGDGQISFPEARATRAIVLPPSGISDLTGLEAFIHLDSLTRGNHAAGIQPQCDI